jgi:hypothetical protein
MVIGSVMVFKKALKQCRIEALKRRRNGIAEILLVQ